MTAFWLTHAVQHLTSNVHCEDLNMSHLCIWPVLVFESYGGARRSLLLHSSQIECLLWLGIIIRFCHVGCNLLAARNCANVLHPDGGVE